MRETSPGPKFVNGTHKSPGIAAEPEQSVRGVVVLKFLAPRAAGDIVLPQMPGPAGAELLTL
jgi:hypothetical protein